MLMEVLQNTPPIRQELSMEQDIVMPSVPTMSNLLLARLIPRTGRMIKDTMAAAVPN
jgi:hypothetical protein